MAYIGNSPFPKGNFSATTHNGGTAVFTMGQSPGTKNAVLVFIDGVRQDPLNYSIAGATLTLGTAAPAGADNVQILVSGEELSVNVPADDSIAVDALDTTSAGTTGQFLQKSGASTIDWATPTVADEIPTQTGHTGKYLTTDGSATSWGTVATTDLTGLRNDIATLALHSAIADNKAAYNLPNSFIDQFEDDSGIGTETDGDRNSGEYWSTAGSGNCFTADGNTKFLLQSNTTNGSTTFTDESATGLTITVAGDTQHKTDQFKHGTSSIYFDGSGDQLYTSDGGATISGLNGGDFCVEMWLRKDSTFTYSNQNTFYMGGSDNQWEWTGGAVRIL